MNNASILRRSLAYLLAVVVGGLLAVAAAPTVQQVSRFVTIPDGVESSLDRVGLDWRPVGLTPAPCGPLTYRIDASAADQAALIHAALERLSDVSGVEFVEVADGPAFITLETVDLLRDPHGMRGLGVTNTISRWVDGRAVIDHNTIQLSREAMTLTQPDFSATGYGWTIFHEAAHAIGVDHLDTPGTVMAPVRGHSGELTELDRQAISAAAAACRP